MSHKCKRCGYETNESFNYWKHLKRINACPAKLSDISTTELLNAFNESRNEGKTLPCRFCRKLFGTKQTKYQHEQRCKKNPTHQTLDNTDNTANLAEEHRRLTEQLKLANQEKEKANQEKERYEKLYYDALQTKRKCERTYQDILERYYGQGHKTLQSGVTDITTDTFHGEIKAWNCWKEAIGQLRCYNSDDPKAELHVYLFGQYDKTKKDIAKQRLLEQGFKVYEIVDENNTVVIHNIEDDSKTVVWQVAHM